MSRFYTTQIGTAEWRRWFPSDSYARKVAARWIRMFWSRHVAAQPAGSIARDICERDPWCHVVRHASNAAGVILCQRLVRVDSYALSP